MELHPYSPIRLHGVVVQHKDNFTFTPVYTDCVFILNISYRYNYVNYYVKSGVYREVKELIMQRATNVGWYGHAERMNRIRRNNYLCGHLTGKRGRCE